jgi:uncharacterized protein (TIGR03435 family)
MPAVWGFNSPLAAGFERPPYPLFFLVQYAYEVEDFRILAAPKWISSDLYDIMAKAETPESPASLNEVTPAGQKQQYARLRERLRSLLADRFHLAVHRETKDQPVYSLVVGKGGHKLSLSAEEHGFYDGPTTVEGRGVTMDRLAEFLDVRIGRPVLNRTGLTGSYAFEIQWTDTPDDVVSPIITAIQDQLGLKLESGRAPVDVIVIDHIEKPTAN